jgi:hypothetical protein
VHPATASTLDARVAFNYNAVEAGAQISDHVAVTNESQHDQVFAVYAADAYTTSKGAYDLLPAGQPSTKAGAWIRLAKDSVNLKPGQRSIIPFTVTVPPYTAPGDYSAGIVAQITVAGVGGHSQVDERIGARVYVRVAGQLHASLGVSGLLASYQDNVNPAGGGTTTVTYLVTNTGNVRLGYAQQVAISGWFGSETVNPPSLAQLLPGNSIAVRAKVPDVWPAGPLTAKVTLTAREVAGTVSPPVPQAYRSSSLLEFPWPQVIAFILLAVLALGAWWAVQRRRATIAALLVTAEERARARDSADNRADNLAGAHPWSPGSTRTEAPRATPSATLGPAPSATPDNPPEISS